MCMLCVGYYLPQVPLGYKKVLHGVRDEQVSIRSPPEYFLNSPVVQR